MTTGVLLTITQHMLKEGSRPTACYGDLLKDSRMEVSTYVCAGEIDVLNKTKVEDNGLGLGLGVQVVKHVVHLRHRWENQATSTVRRVSNNSLAIIKRQN